MKLLSCYIDNFGKLHDLHLDFKEGINVVNQPNGWGKSTLAAFLKVMLFGLNNRREAGMEETERKIHQPWQGGGYGGELDIEVAGRKYRIRRSFGSSERMDTFKLFDLETGRESHDFSSNIGEEIFDLDQNSFRKTVYLAQNDCETENSASISAKLGNLSEASEEVANFERVNEVIQSRLEQLIPSNQAGTLVRRKNLIQQLRKDKKTLDTAEKRAWEIQDKMAEKKKQYQELIHIRSEYASALMAASEDSRRKEMYGSYEQMRMDRDEHMQAMKECERSFPNGILSDEVFDELRDLIRRIEEQNTLINHLELSEQEITEYIRLEKNLRPGVPNGDMIWDLLNHATRIAQSQRKRSNMEGKLADLRRDADREKEETYIDPNPAKSALPTTGFTLGLIGVILLGAGAIAAFVPLGSLDLPFMVGAVVLGLGGILLLIGLVLYLTGKRSDHLSRVKRAYQVEERERQLEKNEKPIQEQAARLEKIDEEIAASEDFLRDALAPYAFLNRNLPYQGQVYELNAVKKQYEELADKKSRYQEACSKRNQLEEKLRLFGIEVGPAMTADVDFLQTKAAEYNLLATEWRKLNQRIQAFERANDLTVIADEMSCPYTLDELNDMILEADQAIESIRNSINQSAKQLEDLQQELDDRDEKEIELKIQTEMQAKEAGEYELLELTRHYLNKAKDKYTAKYMGPITEAFSKYYRALTGSTADGWMIDSNLALKLREHGKMRDAKWLSAGYRDLLGVCMRMAMVDAMYPGEKPFLIFDDPFVNLDDEKLENGKELLYTLSREYQLIYFTCHESRQVPGPDEII